MIDPWSRPREFLPRGQACPSISPTSAESGTPIRARLIERLNERVRVSAGGTPGVTLISAVAGFGKTTRVSK